MSALLKDAAKLTTSRVVALGVGLVSTMLLSRFRTLTEYGTYSQLILLGSVVTTLFMLGVPNSLNYFLARASGTEERRDLRSTFLTYLTLVGAATGVLLAVAAPLAARYFRNEAILGYAYFLAVYPWATILQSCAENLLVVEKRTGTLVVYRSAVSLGVLGSVIVCQALGQTFQTYLVAYVAVQACAALAVYAVAGRMPGGLRVALDGKALKRILAFSAPLGLATVLGTLNLEMGKLVVGALATTEQLAVYTNAAREMPVTILSASIAAVLLPEVARMLQAGRPREALDLWGRTAVLSFLVLAPFAVLLILYAPQWISVLYSAKYLSGVAVFRVASLLVLLRVTYFGLFLNALGKTRFILYSSLAALVLTAGLSYVLYTVLGIVGLALATVLSNVFTSLFQLTATARQLKLRLREIFPWRELLRLAGVNALLAAVLLGANALLQRFLGDAWVWAALPVVALAGGVYLRIHWKRAVGIYRTMRRIETAPAAQAAAPEADRTVPVEEPFAN